MKAFRYFGLVGLVFMAAACSGFDSKKEVQALNDAQAVGSPFSQQLTAEYRAFSNFELKKEMDYADALHFARKGLQSASGVEVMPEQITDWDLGAEQIPEFVDARGRLVNAFDLGAREIMPGKTAVAQARYDCWIEQAEEARTNNTAPSCRDEFLTAMADVEAGLPEPMPEPMPEPVAPVEPAPEPMDIREAMYLVFFDFDSAVVGTGGQSVLDAVVNEVNNRNIQTINIVGHTDRSGTNRYNDALAMRRSEAVRNELAARGIDPSRVIINGQGETELLVETADGVREPANRRATITFQ